MTHIDWLFIINAALLVVIVLVGIADLLQAGVVWPCLAMSVAWGVAAVAFRRVVR